MKGTEATLSTEAVLAELHAAADVSNLAGQARYGIDTAGSLGISAPVLRRIAKQVGRNHRVALELWETAIRDARILAALIDDPEQVTGDQMDAWCSEFSSWDVVDACCCNLFDRTELRYDKAFEWAGREPEFEKRAAFSLMAGIAVHDKKAADDRLGEFLPVIVEHSCDRRNFVRKAVNWALRQIGKRNLELNASAIEAAGRIAAFDCPGARWVASDALRELTGDKVQERLRRRQEQQRPGRR